MTTPTLPDNLIPTITYTVQSTENTFSYRFYVVDSDDMYVYVNGTEISSNNYTISGVGDVTGGFVEIDTNLTPLTPGDTVTLSRFTLPEQLTTFLRTGDFTADAVNAEFNRIYALLQERDEELNRAIKVEQGEVPPTYDELSEDIDARDAATLAAANAYTNRQVFNSGSVTVESLGDVTDFVFSTIDDMKNGILPGAYDISADLPGLIVGHDLLVTVQGYYNGWSALNKPAGAARHVLTTLQRVRDGLGDQTWEPSGYGTHYILGGTLYVSFLIEPVVTFEMFGAVEGDSGDYVNHIQDAIDFSGMFGAKIDTGTSNKSFNINGPLYLRSYCNISGNAMIENTNQAGDINSVVLMPGGFNPAYFDDYTYHSVSSVATDGITLVVALASNYSVGDLVWVVSDEKWAGNSGDYPVFGQLCEVISTDTNEVVIDHPLAEDIFSKYTGVSICQAEDSTVADLLGNPLEYCRNARIDGISIKSSVGSVIARGGMYKCNFNFSEIDGKNNVFANSFCRTNVKVENLTSSRKMMDIAGHSHDFNIDVKNASYQYNAAVSESIAYCRTGECSRDGNVHVGNMNANGFIFGEALCQIDSGCHRVKMTIDNVIAKDHIATPFKLNQSVVASGTQLTLEDCQINVKADLGDNCQRGAWINDPAGVQYVVRCGFGDLRLINGSYSTGYAVELGGTDAYCNGYCDSGNARMPTGIEKSIVRGYFADGASSVESNNDILITSDAGINSKVGNTRQQIVNVTEVDPLEQIILSTVFPANSLSAGDRWKIEFIGEKIGTAGDLSLSLTDDDGDSVDFTVSAANQGEFNGFFEVIVQNNSRYTLYGMLNFEGGITVVDYIDSVEDLTTQSSFSVSASKGNSGDTVRLHSIDSKVSKLYHQ